VDAYADIDGDSQYFYRSDADFPESGIIGATDLTVQMWINTSGLDAHQGILSKWEDSLDKRMYAMELRTSGEFNFYTSSDGTAGTQRNRMSTNAGIVPGRWYHIAVAYDASEGACTFYKDGVALTDSGAPLNTSIADKTPTFAVGQFVITRFFSGKIFNVALFDDKRTAGEILASANDRQIDLSAEANLVGQWMFNEAANAAAIDNTQGDADRDLIPYDGGDVTFGNCGRTAGLLW
jgi:hypothetical protein